MGRAWDYDVPSAFTWSGIERVLKPGAPGLVFGGSRTFHRLVVALEDGGFDPRDLLMWIYGSGFPKSHDVSKAIDKKLGATRRVIGKKKGTHAVGASGVGGMATGIPQQTIDVAITEPSSPEAQAWDGYGSALKPSYEPIALVRKFTEETIARNAMRWGVGALAIDASRIGDTGGGGACPGGDLCVCDTSGRSYSKTKHPPRKDGDVGRWPPNVILDREAAVMLDGQSGNRPGMKSGGKHRKGYAKDGRVAFDSPDAKEAHARGDSGGASRFHKVVDWQPVDHEIADDVLRFYYSPKADRYQREAGLEGQTKRKGAGRGALREPRPGSEANTREGAEVGNHHPTVKPVELIRYLARLILPPPHADGSPRRILVPYAGVSSEMIGCLQAGWDEVVGIEREAEYIEIAKARLTKGGVMSGLMDRKMRKRRG